MQDAERRVLAVGEVARMLRVDKKTVNRYAIAGKLTWFKTPGGHRRYYEDEVQEFIKAHGNRGAAR